MFFKTARRGVGIILVVVILLFLVVMLMGIGQNAASSQVLEQTRRVSVGTSCHYFAESACEEISR